MIKNNIYDPGYPLGTISAQSITQPLTQDTLSSFHKTGSRNQMIENIQKFQELTQNINNNNTSFCNIILNKKLSNKDIYCMLVYKRFFNFIKILKKININRYKEYWIQEKITKHYSDILEITIYKEYQYKYKNLKNIITIIKNYLDNKLNDTYFIINSPEHISKILIFYNNSIIDNINFNDIKICGIKNILDITNIKENNNIITITTIGSNLNTILSNKNIDKINTISNNIKDIYDNLGIESARFALLKELKNISNIEYAIILVNCMTVLGKVSTVSSRGVCEIDKSFLSNISYENSMKTLKKNIPFGVHEKIDNINKNIIIGSKPNIGTGIIKFYKKLNLNIIFFNKNDKKYVEIYYKKVIIKKNISFIFQYQNTKNKMKKLSPVSYEINSIVKINKILSTILKIIINKDIKAHFIDENCLKITIKDLNSIKELKYNIIQGINIFEIIGKDSNILLDKFIIPSYNEKMLNIKIDDLKKNEKNNIELIIKPKNKLNSKIIVVNKN